MVPSPIRHHLRPAALVLGVVLVGGCVDYGVSDDDQQAPESLVVEEMFTQAAAPMVDVLWVIDNTASMAREQTQLAASFRGFVAALEDEGVAYQLGVVTTDVSDEQAGVLQGVPWIVTPEQDDPVAAFSEAVQVGIDGSGPEAGLGAAWLALGEPLVSTDNRGFLRAESLLHVVIVSDSDDHSDELLEPWLADGDTPTDLFLDFLDERAAVSGHPPIVSAVAGDVPSGCYGLVGRAQPATVYHDVVDATGGVFASICSGDMAPVVEGLGDASLVYADTFLLRATPLSGSLRVWVDDERQAEGWQWQEQPSALVFDEPPPPDASIRVRYSVAEEPA